MYRNDLWTDRSALPTYLRDLSYRHVLLVYRQIRGDTPTDRNDPPTDPGDFSTNRSELSTGRRDLSADRRDLRTDRCSLVQIVVIYRHIVWVY